jgi:malate dehydrogenase (oxaloacetate-decarboxylating)(NADP+)
MTDRSTFSEALDYHERGRPGKLEIRPTKPTATQADLSLAYTPGVAEPCLAIARDPANVYRYTNKGNLVAVVSNGTAVLGLGNIGPMAGKPVMEGKGVLFKRFADIDVYDLEIGSEDPEDVIRFCELLEPTVGGINLEDIKAPDCFYIEQTLRDRLDIPVFHDDQHGTAIIAGAAFLNALLVVEKDIADVRVVFSGAGAAGIATARFFQSLGVRPEHLLMVDSKGVVHSGRDDLNDLKLEFVRDTEARTLADAMVGADAFVGVSVAGTVSQDMVRSMADRPIVFALANPDSEITYDDAKAARDDVIVATGRSDFPNQVNNVLGFPFIFRGALDVRATGVSEGMKVAAARGLAELAQQEVPESVLKAYGADRISFGPDYLIPKPFDPRVLWTVAPAVAMAATEEGLARLPLADIDEYRERLRARFQSSYGLIQAVTGRAKEKPKTVVFPHGDDSRIIRAARRVLDEGIASPVLLGDVGLINELAVEMGISIDGIRVIDPVTELDLRARYSTRLLDLRRNKGMSAAHAQRQVYDPNVFACLMVELGEADAVLGGLTTFYPETIRPALQIIRLEEHRTIASSVYVVYINGTPYFFTDCAVNIEPSSEELAEIAVAACEVARDQFDRNPRVAFLSYSDFGSATGDEPARVRRAVQIFHELCPDVPADGEMQADTAVMGDLIRARRPHGQLDRAANVLVFPTLTAGNAAYKLLNRLADAEVIGPILTGLAKSVHVLQRDAEVGDVVNLTAIAVSDAQRKG